MLRVYFLRDGKVGAVAREVPATQGVGAAAIRELLRGPSDGDEQGLTTAIPSGTKLVSLSVTGGTAHVELSGDALDGKAVSQIVYTLTQFPSVDAVVVGTGDPLTRQMREDDTPQILVETPAPGVAVKSPLGIGGTANTFEATFVVQLLDETGKKLAAKVVTATSGSGTRGTFAEQLDFTVDHAVDGTLVAFEPNAGEGENGTGPQLHRVDIPLRLQP